MIGLAVGSGSFGRTFRDQSCRASRIVIRPRGVAHHGQIARVAALPVLAPALRRAAVLDMAGDATTARVDG
jgi:hypothetical protein